MDFMGLFVGCLNLGLTYFLALPIFSLGMLMMLIKEYGKEATLVKFSTIYWGCWRGC